MAESVSLKMIDFAHVWPGKMIYNAHHYPCYYACYYARYYSICSLFVNVVNLYLVTITSSHRSITVAQISTLRIKIITKNIFFRSRYLNNINFQTKYTETVRVTNCYYSAGAFFHLLFTGEGQRDENYLFGLTSLINIFKNY